MSEKINIGIIGFGRIGRVHYKNIVAMDNVNIKVVCDILADESWEKEFPEINFCTNYLDVLKDPEIKAVLICTPTNLHPEMIIQAAKAKKDIFCEKPVGFDNDDILKAYQVVKDNNVKFATGFNRRYDKHFRRITDYLANNSIGIPHILKITSRDPEPPSLDYVSKSGGIFMDMTIHDFDMARYITKQEIDEVYVIGNVLIDDRIKQYNDLDTAIITLKFHNGMMGVIDNSRQAVYGYDQRIELFGSKGMAHADNVLESETKFLGNNCMKEDKPMFFFLQRYMEAYDTELKSFFEAVQGKHDVECSFEDGIKAIRLAEAAERSYQSGKPEKVQPIN